MQVSSVLTVIACRAPSPFVCYLSVCLVQGVELPPLEGLRACEEYLQLCEQHPTHLRMVRGHVHKLITVGAAACRGVRLCVLLP